MVNAPSTVSITLGYLGIAAALGLFLSPVPTCRRICRKKSSEHFSALPYLAQLVESSWWALWAVAAGDRLEMLFNNLAGASFMAVYVIVFLVLPCKEHRVKIYCQSVLALLLVGIAVAIAVLVESPDHIFGLSAVTLNILKYSAPLSVAKHVIETQSVEFLPLPLTLASLACGIFWGGHGLALMDFYILVPNVAGILCAVMQIGLHLRYGGYFGSKMTVAQQQKECDTTYEDVEGLARALVQRLDAIPDEHRIWQNAGRAIALSKCKTDVSDFVKFLKLEASRQPEETTQAPDVALQFDSVA